MNKTIILTNYEFSPAVTRVLFFLFGIGHTSQGLDKLLSSELTTGRIIFGVILLSTGLLILFLGIALFSKNFWLTPKITIDNENISIREKMFSKAKTIQWNEVREITYRSFTLDILQNNSTLQTFLLKTNAEVSIEVKKVIREVAASKSIPVLGG